MPTTGAGMAEYQEGTASLGAGQVRAAEHDTLDATPERARLTHRAARVEMVLEQLRERRRERTGPVPKGLDQAIDGFSIELRKVRAQLAASERLPAAEPCADDWRTPVTKRARS